jgi:putative restriction endonuclease
VYSRRGIFVVGEIGQILSKLPVRHREVLQWFADHAGRLASWPKPLHIDGAEVLLASKAKGIYKPAWSEYAVSVRQGVGGTYPDKEPIAARDGSWVYAYFQENRDQEARDQEYTNQGMLACWHDRIPIGVMRQVAAKPNSRYMVLGLAMVTGWDGGYFFLESIGKNGDVPERGPSSELLWLSHSQEAVARGVGAFDPRGIIDARERVIAQIVLRRGQPEFRRQLLEAYNSQCAISRCSVTEALEAAHITPFRGSTTNRVENGLLLRADIHTLFDLGLLAVDPDSMTVLVSGQLAGSTYAELSGRALHVPIEMSLRPSIEALRVHREWSGL